MIRPSPEVSRLSTLPPTAAALVLGAALLLMLLGLLGGVQPARQAATSGPTDLGLYARAVDLAAHPSTFYASLVAEQRREGYPLRPFVTVRPPALPFVLAALPGETARRLAVQVLALATLGVWAVRLRGLGGRPWIYALAVVAAATGVLPAFARDGYLMHEVWAGLLIALSLALNRPKTWALSLALGLAAALIRELAAPYLLVMALMAWIEGRRGQAAAWTAALGAFAAAMAGHAWAVGLYVQPNDAVSQGWLRFGGWPFVLRAAQWNAGLAASPGWLAAVALPLAILGACAWTGGTGGRLGLTVTGFIAGLLIFGRPENVYWGLLIAPLLPLGLIMAPAAIITLMRRANRGGAGAHPAPAE